MQKGVELVGGTKHNRGEKNYVASLCENVFEGSLSEETQQDFKNGDGNETNDSEARLAKMKALHSSSALAVNVFQYWQHKDVNPILYACRLSNRKGFEEKSRPNTVRFEQKFEISNDKKTFPRSPNLDVVIACDNMVYAIESKFTEPYKGKQKGLNEKYLGDKTFWRGIPKLEQLARENSPKNKTFKYLDAAQLLKHILGLKTQKGKTGFKLLYLWYDVLGKDGFEHRKEIEVFAEIAKKDNVQFRAISYQEVIINLSKNFYKGNKVYVDYLTNRYL